MATHVDLLEIKIVYLFIIHVFHLENIDLIPYWCCIYAGIRRFCIEVQILYIYIFNLIWFHNVTKHRKKNYSINLSIQNLKFSLTFCQTTKLCQPEMIGTENHRKHNPERFISALATTFFYEFRIRIHKKGLVSNRIQIRP